MLAGILLAVGEAGDDAAAHVDQLDLDAPGGRQVVADRGALAHRVRLDARAQAVAPPGKGSTPVVMGWKPARARPRARSSSRLMRCHTPSFR